MKRWAFLVIFCLVYTIITLGICDIVKADETDSSFVLADLAYEIYPKFSRVILASNEKLDFVTYELQDPYRIVVDLIGVAFCELEEHASYDEGLVDYVDIVKTPYVKKQSGLDDYFYAVDYVIITPTSEFPHTVSSFESGKVLAIDIGESEKPGLKTSKVRPKHERVKERGQDIENLPKEVTALKEPQEKKIVSKPQSQETSKTEEEIRSRAQDKRKEARDRKKKERKRSQPQIKERILDYITFEPMEDTSLLVIASNKDIEFEIKKKYYPRYGIRIRPKGVVFTELEQLMSLDNKFARSIHIERDKTVKNPPHLDRYFYPVKHIFVEHIDKNPYEFYSNEDGTISVLEIQLPKPKEKKPRKRGKKDAEEAKESEEKPRRDKLGNIVEQTKEPIEDPLVIEEPRVELDKSEMEPILVVEEVEPITREDILREFKEEIKREGILRKARVVELTKEEQERQLREAAEKTKTMTVALKRGGYENVESV
ncbi:hypothetical protein ACFL0T_08405, partial [Candidatus Omnitrophota bacterium]